MEKRMLTKQWDVRFNTAILLQCGVNAVNGRVNVLGHKGDLKSLIHDLGIQLIARGRNGLRELHV